MTPVYKLMERGEGKEGDRGRGRRERREERERGERERERDWAKWTDLMLSSDEPRHPFPRWIISAPLNHRTGGAERRAHGKLHSTPPKHFLSNLHESLVYSSQAS